MGSRNRLQVHGRTAHLTATTPAAVLRDFILTYFECKWHFGATGRKFFPQTPHWTWLCAAKCFWVLELAEKTKAEGISAVCQFLGPLGGFHQSLNQCHP